MHMPTKAQWAKVIENFYRVYPLTLELGEGQLNMAKPLVNRGAECGTVHCAGGWYAIATHDIEKEQLDFLDGANQMALDLGFDQTGDNFYSPKGSLENWAHSNPKIWGNAHGIYMFYQKRAWGNATSIEQIIHHLEGVHDRTPE